MDWISATQKSYDGNSNGSERKNDVAKNDFDDLEANVDQNDTFVYIKMGKENWFN